jgi:SAM-dependent methyltransferase
MAIGPTHIEWLSHLARRSAFSPDATVLDLGPQDIQIDRESLYHVACRHLPPDRAEAAMAEIFADGTAPRADAQKAFYAIFGARAYRSVDLCDPRASYAADLNQPLPDLGRYDLITNFGTTEHVFNIGGTFASIHRILKVGGVQVHAVPGYAYIDHGYYNVHPSAYLDMARMNNYDVVDFSYVDNIVVRDRSRRVEAKPFDFDALPIRVADMRDTADLMTKVAAQFYRNLISAETRDVLAEMLPPDQRAEVGRFPDPRLPICFVFDLCFVALRRTAASPEAFVPPSQQVFGTPGRSVKLRQLVTRLRARLGV